MKSILMMLLLSLLLIGCSDDSDSNNNDLFSVIVKDEAGNAISDLEVRLTNLSVDKLGFCGRPCTTLSFTIIEEYDVCLEIYNQKNEKIRILYDDIMALGTHSINWDGKDENEEIPGAGGTRIFSYNLTCREPETSEITFEETAFMCMSFNLLEERSSLGITNESGKYINNEVLAFPHLFNPESQKAIDENSNYIKTFCFSDSIKIRLYDPVEDLCMDFVKPMTSSSSNHYELIWNDPQEPEGYKDDNRYVGLSDFTGEYDSLQCAVNLNWSTFMEYDFAGFNLYRRECWWSDMIKLNAEIISAQGEGAGAEYYFLDDNIDIEAASYDYFLEAVETDGEVYDLDNIEVEIAGQDDVIYFNELRGNYPNPFN